MSYMKTSQKIKYYREKKGWTQKDLGEALGVKYQSVQQWEDGVAPTGPKRTRLPEVAKVLGVLEKDLLPGSIENTQHISSSSPHSEQISGVGFNPIDINATLTRRVYIVGTAEAGPDKIWLEQGYPEGYGDEYIEGMSMDKNAYGLIVSGNSMSPSIQAGQALLVEPNNECEPGDTVVVKKKDETVMVKKLASRGGGKIFLDSVNEAFDKIVLKEEEVEFTHYVHSIIHSRSIKQAV